MFKIFKSNKRHRRTRRERERNRSTERLQHTRDLLKHHIRKERLLDDDTRSVKKDKRVKRLQNSLQFKSIQDYNEANRMHVLPSSDLNTMPVVRYTQPQKTPTCIRRELRRKFLFALGFAGKGSVKRAEWTEQSYVRCK